MDFESQTPKILTAILFIPAIGFFVSNQTIQEQAHFLILIGLLASSYFCHAYQFQSKSLDFGRKCIACLSTALLILFLSAEVSDILVSVYKVNFAEEVSFLVKMVLMISNMEGNLDLCLEKEEKTHSKLDNPLDSNVL